MRDMGTGAALIQKHVLNADLKNAVFLFNVLLGILITIALMALSPLLSIFFKEPRLTDVFLVLAPVFTIVSLSAVHQALLERESLFKHIAKIELTSGVAGLGGALFVALQGGGVYALITQSIVTAAVGTILFWIFSAWRPVIEFKFTALKDIFSFSGNIFLFNFVNYLHRNADSMLIGRFLSVSELGFYNIAYRILLFPLQNITFVLSRASFPAYSRNQHNLSLVGKHYLETLETIAFITAPLMALMWALREPMITVVLGERWLPAAVVLAWLAPVGYFQSIVSTSGSILNAIGRSDVLRNLGFVGVPLLTLSFVVGLPWGIEGVAAAYCIGNFFWVYPVIKTVLELVSYSFVEFLTVIVRPTVLGVFVAILTWLFEENNLFEVDIPLLHLVAGVLLGLSIYFILAYVFMRKTMSRLISSLRNHLHT
jgi:O-antigen/teichoic acid export membrane protein